VYTPSILSAIKKLRLLLNRQEKLKWLYIVGFALCTSSFELITASAIACLVKTLSEPEMGMKYLSRLGIKQELPTNHILFYITIACWVIFLIKNLIAAAEVFYQNFSIQKMNNSFKNKLLHRYAQANYEFYLTRNSSLGANVISNDTEQMFSGTLVSLATILSESIVFFCLIVMLILVNPSLAFLIFGISSILGLIVSKGLMPLFYRWGQRFQEASLYASQNLLQFFHAFKEIVLLGKRDAFVNAYQFYSTKTTYLQAIRIATNALPRIIIEILFFGLFAFTIGYLCFKHETPVQIIGTLGVYLYAGFRLMPGLNRIINQLNLVKNYIPAVERVYTEYYTTTAKEHYVDAPEFCFENSICLKDVSFRYLSTETDALSHIHLEIKKGESIGIIGETGSGKSTLVDIILGLLKPYSGSVLIDNQYPTNTVQWHQKIGYVPQSVYLIDNSIETNITFNEKPESIDQNRLEQAITDAQLRKFIDQLPNGRKTIVGERGIRLSGGERQRIAIARALYRNPAVLIFDEATSALDSETEIRLMETIRTVSLNRTVIMIAHRLTTLKNCDRIVVMEKTIIKDIVSYKSLLHV
jgi:ABC-type multidrug transport system fused ATPase/permease subunit